MLLATAAIAACAVPGSDAPFVSYEVRMADPELGLVEVVGSVGGVTARSMPLGAVARDGGRLIEPIELRADAGGEPLDLERTDEGWLVRCGGRDFTFSYRLSLEIEDRYTADVRRMLTSVDGDRCRLHGGDLFLVPLVSTAPGVLVDVDLFPEDRAAAAWKSVGRRIVVPEADGVAGTVFAAGRYRILEETVAGVTIRMAIAGDWRFADEELFDVMVCIARREISWFGGAPVDRYLFVCDRNPTRGASRFEHYGMHTGNTMILLLDPSLDRSRLYDTPMSLVSHEFFHNWNGGAMPAGELWFVEGATVYFSFKALLDTRTIVSGQYSRRRDAVAARFADKPYAGTVAIADAELGDLGDRDMVNLLYDGGFLAAEAVDLRLRRATGGRVGLIDVMRRMYEEKTTADGASLARVAEELAGVRLAPLLDALVRDPASARLLGASGTS